MRKETDDRVLHDYLLLGRQLREGDLSVQPRRERQEKLLEKRYPFLRFDKVKKK